MHFDYGLVRRRYIFTRSLFFRRNLPGSLARYDRETNSDVGDGDGNRHNQDSFDPLHSITSGTHPQFHAS
jgi:hypothetical protein